MINHHIYAWFPYLDLGLWKTILSNYIYIPFMNLLIEHALEHSENTIYIVTVNSVGLLGRSLV